MVGESLLLFTSDVPIGPIFLQLAVALLLSLFLLSGSRVAWGLALFSAAWQFADSLGESQHWWVMAAAVLLIAFLLAPSSVRFVWAGARWRPVVPLFAAVESLYERFIVLSLSVVARMAQWEDGHFGDDAVSAPRRYGVLIWRLGVAVVLLLVLIGTIQMLQDESGGSSVILSVMASVAWIGFMLAFLGCLAALVAAGYSAMARKSREH
jgi:hypothetical protein